MENADAAGAAPPLALALALARSVLALARSVLALARSVLALTRPR